MSTLQVRNVNKGRGYELDQDSFEGFKKAVNTNRTLLSLEYAIRIIEDLYGRIGELEAQVAELSKPKASAAKKVAAKDDTVDAES